MWGGGGGLFGIAWWANSLLLFGGEERIGTGAPRGAQSFFCYLFLFFYTNYWDVDTTTKGNTHTKIVALSQHLQASLCLTWFPFNKCKGTRRQFQPPTPHRKQTKQLYEVIIFLFCFLFFICKLSPWYNPTGWLDVKHQFTYLLCKLILRKGPTIVS